ncbi:UDP-glucose 4-epimerase [Croceifilum oryzae]|uniref:UDP-glucose 4-epimerase n=1 Tax=Croceifilum oryzae TaxID=1553429 RepID=A0AAJ1WNU1_9BACL|nr:SDR family oxidoreductase [Croceifilum oryzae]MDQ0415872.1 UDP-glucose 4-epimerase [Croceifilum oryzae]
MKVLVTGGAGFIGSHIVDQLISEGHEVVVLDNLITGHEEQIHPKATFYRIDITHPEVQQIFEEVRPDAVIHQAAQTHVPTSIEKPIYDANVNIMGVINLLEAAKDTGVRKFVYASSAAVYGEPKYLPIDEHHPTHPISPYGVSKYTVEHYLDVYYRLFGVEYTALRYANVYGIRQDPRGEGGVVSIFTDKVLSKQPLTVFGDGEHTRDYIYVEDVAKANVQALSKGSGEIINIGTGVQTSLNELIEAFRIASGKDIVVTYGPERAGDIKDSYFNAKKATDTLEWVAKIPLLDGLKQTYQYYLEKY